MSKFELRAFDFYASYSPTFSKPQQGGIKQTATTFVFSIAERIDNQRFVIAYYWFVEGSIAHDRSLITRDDIYVVPAEALPLPDPLEVSGDRDVKDFGSDHATFRIPAPLKGSTSRIVHLTIHLKHGGISYLLFHMRGAKAANDGIPDFVAHGNVVLVGHQFHRGGGSYIPQRYRQPMPS